MRRFWFLYWWELLEANLLSLSVYKLVIILTIKNENLLDEELHLKLIKIYLKSSQIGKAVNYLAKIEYKQIFSNQTWYKSVIDEIEATLMRISDDEKQLLVSILTILLFRQLKSTLQTTDDTNSYFEIFLKYGVVNLN